MNQKTRGIILQTTNYSETSLVVKIYTEQHGLGSFIVSGVRSKNSRFKSNIFQPLSLVELVAAGKPGHTMKRISEVQLAPPFSGIPGDIVKSSIALFLAEVIYRSIREEEPNVALFGFLHNSIQMLDLSQENCSRFHIYFMIRLSRHLGFFPHGDCTPGVSIFDLQEGLFTRNLPVHDRFLDQRHAGQLFRLMHSDFDSYREIIPDGASARTLLKAMVTYFEIHHTHGNPIKSHTVLEEVLN
jgi:DNA repair protein RecO (recombination protein O)